MTMNRAVATSAETIHASLASRSTSPLTMVPPVDAPHAQVSAIAWIARVTTVTMPNQRCAATRRSWPYRCSRRRWREVRTRPPSAASAAVSPDS